MTRFEPRTLAERYASAMHSSDLAPIADRRVDVDYIIAAGIVTEGLGTKLYRLASEWDLASGDYRLARARVAKLEEEAARLRRGAQRGTELLAAADRLSEQARAEATTAKALALMRLKTLRSAADALGGYACWLAVQVRLEEPAQVIRMLSGQALQAWLDTACSACGGRGFNGGFNGPKQLCAACGATGRAQHNLTRWRHAAFTKTLMSAMDRKLDIVDRKMRRRLKNNE